MCRSTAPPTTGRRQRAARRRRHGQLAITRDGQAGAARVKFDLDLPSASVDDVAIAEGETCPSGTGSARPASRPLPRRHADGAAIGTPFAPGLAPPPRAGGRRLEVLRRRETLAAAIADGEVIDLDAWVRHAADATAGTMPQRRAARPAGFRAPHATRRAQLRHAAAGRPVAVHRRARRQRCARDRRDPRCALRFRRGRSKVRATPSRCSASARCAASTCACSTSGLRRALEPRARSRVGAIKPGYYTRMGAALRSPCDPSPRAAPRAAAAAAHPHRRQAQRPGRYEGRWGLEDTRHAVHEAREAGLLPFCLSIDEEAHEYLPHLFGRGGWAEVRRPAELPARLASVYARLTR